MIVMDCRGFICIFVVMKPAKIFHQYIWIINMLKAYGELTFEQLNLKWQEDKVTDGKELYRSSFNRHRDAILNMFGIIIDCDRQTFKYHIRNLEAMKDGSIQRWLFSTLTVHGVLADCAAVKERVVLENVPAGLEFLEVIIHAIKTGKKILLTYQRFGADSNDKVVAPYAVKLFHQRWYLLSHTGNHYATYALDRMLAVRLTDETFKMPDDFSPQAYFDEYFGVLTDETPMAHVVIRAYERVPNYLRTLPLHHSQREIATTEKYTDFSFDIRPTADFLGELLSHGSNLEVLEPAEIRQKMKDKIAENLKRY